MKVYVVTESWSNSADYEEHDCNSNGFIGVYSTLENAVEGIKELILSDEHFDSSELDPPFDKIDFTPVLKDIGDNGMALYSIPYLYYNGGWDMEQYDVLYDIQEVEMD